MEIKKKVNNTKSILIAALILIIVLAIVFIFTLPGMFQDKKFEDMNNSEKIAYVEKEQNTTNDKSYYDAAKLFKDRKYCEFILDAGLKRRCVSETPEPAPITNWTSIRQQSEQEQADNSYYDAARLFKDKKYCEFIVDESIKTECLSVVK